MASKHSPEPDAQGETQPSGGERAKGSHWSSPPSNESGIGFESREDYKPRAEAARVLRPSPDRA